MQLLILIYFEKVLVFEKKTVPDAVTEVAL